MTQIFHLPTQRRSDSSRPARAIPYDRLRARLEGPLALPGSEEYAPLAAAWNVAVPVRPAAVVGARSAQDVVETVRFAARHRLAVTPQATGHGAVEGLIGEIVVATAALDECVVHPSGWARVGAGVKWGRVVQEAARHGLAPLNGSSTDVGVVGYTTGGGLGPMARTYGVASDRVRAIEVVTGDGILRRVTPHEHPNLFFGLRGGKGALGIVTAIEFDLVRQPQFYGGALYFDGADAPTVIDRWRTWCQALPEQATTSVAVMQLPPLPAVPPVLAGRMTVAVRFVWTGESDRGAALLQQMRDAAPVLLDGVAVMPYEAIDAVHADPVDPMPIHEGAALLADLPSEAVAALMSTAGPGSGSQQIIVELRQLGGRIARPGEHESAFGQRSAAYSFLTIGVPFEPGVVENAARIRAALAPWATGGMLPNFAPSDHGAEACYDPHTLTRLRAAVHSYDPAGVMAVGRALFAPPRPAPVGDGHGHA